MKTMIFGWQGLVLLMRLLHDEISPQFILVRLPNDFTHHFHSYHSKITASSPNTLFPMLSLTCATPESPIIYNYVYSHKIV